MTMTMPLNGPAGPGRPLDASDLPWLGTESTYLLVGLTTPPVAEVRRALAAAMGPGSPLARLVDRTTATWHPIEDDERTAWVAAMVRPGPVVAGDVAAAHALVDRPLGLRPLVVVVCPDALLVRVDHVAGDAGSVHALVRRLLGSGEPPVPTAWSASKLQRRLLSAAARHPWHSATAVATHRHPSTEEYVPASEAVGTMRPVSVTARTEAAWSQRLLALRDRHWPDASFSAVLVVGLRRALAAHVAAPRPGTELLVDLRGRYLGSTAPELGNLARGMYVCARDDDDPADVGRAVRRDLDLGLPVIDLAASMLRSRVSAHGREGAAVPEPRVAVGGLGPRLAVSYLRGLGGGFDAAWHPGGGLWTSTTPNGPEGVTVLVSDLAGAFQLDASCYAEVIDPARLQTALEHLLQDPEGLLTDPADRAASRPAASPDASPDAT